MACALELERTSPITATSTLKQWMHIFIKTIMDNPDSINSSVSQMDLIHHTLIGLSREYETLVTTLTHLPLQLSFDDLRLHLLFHEKRLRILDNDDYGATHPTLSTQHTAPSNNAQSNGHNDNAHRGGGCNNNNRNRQNHGGSGGNRNRN